MEIVAAIEPISGMSEKPELVPVVAERAFLDIAGLSREEIRELIADTERVLLTYPQVEVPIEHHFSKDVYGREMKLEQGTLIVGKIHRFENLNILSEGEVSVLSIDGVKRVKAPHTFVASPGAKRVIFAHTNVTWTTIHGTGERDVDKIEEQFIAKSYEEIEPKIIEAGETKCLGS